MSAKSRRTAQIDKQAIFISHDSREATLAAQFSKTLSVVTAGRFEVFRSSDITGKSGIVSGFEWYDQILTKLKRAAHVISLLTPCSIERPWVHFEAGVAKGGSNTWLHAVAIGLDVSQIEPTSPLGHMPVCQPREAHITSLIVQIAKSVPNCDPDERILKREVKRLLGHIKRFLEEQGPIRQLHHVSLPVKRLERSVKFYKEVLSLRPIIRPLFPFPGAWFGLPNGQHLHLVLNRFGTYRRTRVAQPRDVHLALQTDDWAGMLSRLDRKGIHYSPETKLYGYRQIYFHDPDKHVIEINCPSDNPYVMKFE